MLQAHMKKLLSTASILLLSPFLFAISFLTFASEPLDLTPAVGTWEGESKCTMPNSPCKDEHVIYHTAVDKSAPNKVRLEVFKVVEGKQELEGTLDCTYRAGEILDCTTNAAKKDRWEFKIFRDRMIGSLIAGDERTLYRRMVLRKK
jgi:hypothetical protein